MGTRGAIGFILNEKEYITYNHFDSYPEGLGNHILKFIHSVKDMEELKQKVNKIELIDEKAKPTPAQIERCKLKGTININVSDQSYDDWYCLLREAQGLIGVYADVGLMIDNHNFLKDSLFCEWAYIINFDTNKLEVYQGFNKDKNAEGRYASTFIKYEHRDTIEYYGVRLIHEIDLFNSPIKFKEHYDEDADKATLELVYDEDWKNILVELH
jgi:hypothetical protein